jgi:hypothetical protein
VSNITDLETIVTWEGSIDNERIRQLLGVKAVWASRLMGELVKRLGRRGRRATAHAPLEFVDAKQKRRSPDEYLRVVSAHQSGENGPMLEDARLDLSTVAPDVFSIISKAAKRQTGVRIVYRSMTTPAGSERIIYPHALVRAPRRWHVRAWCDQRGEFRDFTLGRIASAAYVELPSSHPQAEDAKWNRKLELVIVAHPGLTIEQQELIALEYFPGARAMRLSIRECLAAYAIQDLRLALDAEKEAPPEFQLLVSNSRKLPLTFSSERKSV